MSDTQQKFLDQKGVEYLWSKISMQDYPNNETLISVINAIDETKADKTEIPFIDDTLVLGDAAANAKAVGDALAEKADKQNGIYYVEGTEDSTTSGLKGTSLEITELYEGLTIAYKMPIDFTANQPVFLRINDLQETRVYNIGTNYNFGPIAKGSIIIFVYTETDGLYYWHADWDRPQAQFGVDPSSEKRYLTATATIGGGITLLNTNDNCYMKDGELYSGNEKVGKHQNSIFYVVAGGSTNVWTASHSDITEYYDGLTIACRTTIGGGYPTTTLNINDLGAISIRRASGQDLTYAYKADSLLHLTYTIINGVGYWSMSDLWYTDTDAKVSSGNASNTKLFLVGAKTQNSNSTSGVMGYSNNGCYIGSDNLLYSNHKPVLTGIDNTLTIENVAADAKATGDLLNAKQEQYIVYCEGSYDDSGEMIISPINLNWDEMLLAIQDDKKSVICKITDDEGGIQEYSFVDYDGEDAIATFSCVDERRIESITIASNGRCRYLSTTLAESENIYSEINNIKDKIKTITTHIVHIEKTYDDNGNEVFTSEDTWEKLTDIINKQIPLICRISDINSDIVQELSFVECSVENYYIKFSMMENVSSDSLSKQRIKSVYMYDDSSIEVFYQNISDAYILYANRSYNYIDDSETYSIENFDWAEMASAIEANKPVIIRTNLDDEYFEDFPLTEYMPVDGYAIFGAVTESGVIKTIEVYASGNIYSVKRPIISIDKTLKRGDMAADAKATGEAIAAPKYVAQDTAPEDTNLLWIDTSDEVGTTADPKTEIILKSSTAGSTKQFRITINDDGVLTATEIG